MKILLFNDNPVVRKLVALSAQKTKDDLSVVWSTDEIEGSTYDLLIIDDALYSDEIAESINLKISVKSKLLMATRGNSVPDGFDHVINKPFLPTDLVDMLIQIEKNVADTPTNEEEPTIDSSSVYSINLEDTLPEGERDTAGSLNLEELDEHDDDFDFGDFRDFEEKLPEMGILDQEEVQEVQGLLEDTEEEPPANTEESILVQGFDDLDIHGEEDEVKATSAEEFNFDELLNAETLKLEERDLSHELLDEDEFGDIELSSLLEEDAISLDEEKEKVLDENDFEEMDLTELTNNIDSLDENDFDEMDLSDLVEDEHYLDKLEAKIEVAVSGLESAELEREVASDDFETDFDDSLLEDIAVEIQKEESLDKSDADSFDEFDLLDEKELKRAVGEEDESDIFSDEELLPIEEDDSVDNIDFEEDESLSEVATSTETTSHSEGVDALQALLKALANEDVAKSLKGMNISININFGNDK